MKSGTTTLYHDLRNNPAIFLAEKEQNPLTRSTPRDEYRVLLNLAKPHQLCGDVSVRYSMLPDHAGVVQRAKALLPPSTKIIYLVREPVARAISHHYHFYSLRDSRRMPASFEQSLQRFPGIVEYGRYGRQLEPWIAAFGLTAIKVVALEDYARARENTVKDLLEFLEAPSTGTTAIGDEVRNASTDKPVLSKAWRRMLSHPIYRRCVRPLIPLASRDTLRKTLLPKAPPRPALPSIATVDAMLDVFREDEMTLRQLTGRSQRFWDFDQVRSRIVETIADKSILSAA